MEGNVRGHGVEVEVIVIMIIITLQVVRVSSTQGRLQCADAGGGAADLRRVTIFKQK